MAILETSPHLRSIVTRRSLLPPPGDRGDPVWTRSWRHLFERYAHAMQRYVRRILTGALGKASEEEARDVVQAYFAKAIEKDWLSRDGDTIRCFRAYLQAQLRRFTYDWLDRRHARKRSPGATAPAEALHAVAGGSEDPSEIELDRGWVQTAVDATLEALREGNRDYYEVIADLLRTDGEGSPDLAERMGRSETQLVHLRHRARKRFAALFHDELRTTVRDDEAFEDLCRRLTPYLP